MSWKQQGRYTSYQNTTPEPGYWPFWGCFGPTFPARVTSADLLSDGDASEVWINHNEELTDLRYAEDIRGIYLCARDPHLALLIFRGGSYAVYQE